VPAASGYHGLMSHDSPSERAASTLVRLPVLDVPVTVPDGAFASTVAPASPANPAVALLDDTSFAHRYDAGATLGEGGMGVVRAAGDHRIGREVAMKTMRAADGARRDLVARFLREACVQGQLEHPAIVPVYDLGRDPEGAIYFTMKRVRGVTFEQIVARLRLNDPEALRQYSRRRLLSAFVSVCQAVEFAHARGVVHRDLKPANVMVGDFGEVYVLDWGVAKLVGTPDALVADRPSIISTADGGPRTMAGATMGTPGYMAPEQARGEPVDGRADVYSLGAILFELLCLQPLHGRTTVEAALGSTLLGADARASVRAPQMDVPPELEAMCVKATALDPAARFQSAQEVIDCLERFLDGDRDLERRRELAAQHTRSARQAALEALAEGQDEPAARTRALREVGRALALDPSNTEAIATLVRLLTLPPKELPAEAAAEIRSASARTQRAIAKGAMFGYLAWFLFVPFGVWMGVRDPVVSLVASALWAVAAVTAYVALRRPDGTGRVRTAAFLATSVAACATSAVCGPYVLVPTLAVINVILWLLLADRSQRATIVGLACLSILLPAVLEWTHLVRFYYFRDRRVTIVPSMLHFPAVPTHAFLLAASLMLVVLAAVLIIRFRDDLSEAERRLHLQAWQLKQLLPPEAHDASDGAR